MTTNTNTSRQIHWKTCLHNLINNHLHATSSTTQTMDKTVATPYMVIQQCMKNGTITEKEGKKIVNKKSL